MPGPYGVSSRFRVCRGEQTAEVRVTAPALDEQRDVSTAVERYLGSRDRPHAERLRRVRELERAVDAVVVGEGERLVPELRRARSELLRLRGAVQERVRRVAVQLDVAHASGMTWEELFDPGMGRVIREWLLAPADQSDKWEQLVEQAIG